jgi:Zn-dependent M28 family amino/carboxypeptidase
MFWLVVAMVLASAGFLGWFFMIRMPGRSHEGPIAPLSPEERALAEELEKDVRELAGRIGERSIRRPRALAEAAEFIERSLTATGLRVRRLRVDALAADNVEAELAGSDPAAGIVVVGAHYDTVEGCPGANDNGTGVAAMLALARRFATTRPARTLRFVAFPGEEPPTFETDAMGSAAYAKACRANGETIVAMLSLETLGCYSDAPGSQHFPIPLLGLIFPDRGDFVTFVGNMSSASLVRRAIGAFRESARFPSEGAALPSWIPGVGWSDHASFWRAGYPAIMVTDTAPFRYPHYHLPTDTPDRVDYERLARVVRGLVAVLERL